MNWGIANSNFLFISLRQSKRTSTSTAEIHASSYFQVLCSPLLFALVTLHFSLPPTRCFWNCLFSYWKVQACISWRRWLIGWWEIKGLWLGQGNQKAKWQFSYICYQSSILLHCFTATRLKLRNWNYGRILLPWPGLQSALQLQAFFSSCAQGPEIPASVNLVWKTSSTSSPTKSLRAVTIVLPLLRWPSYYRWAK